MMRMVGRVLLSGAIALSFVAEFSSLSGAQPAPLIAQPVNNAQRITLVGNTRPEANLANDRGAVLDNFEMPHMLLQLKRSDALQQAITVGAITVGLPVTDAGAQGASRPPGRAVETNVDVELVIAVDVSYSMDPDEQALQREGYIIGLTSPEFLNALHQGMHGKIAITHFEWAGSGDQRIVVPWWLIDGPASARAFADEIARAPYRRAYRTSISGALRFAQPLFENSGFRGLRRVIDVSGDGVNNQGVPVTLVRDEALERGITTAHLLPDRRAHVAGTLGRNRLQVNPGRADRAFSPVGRAKPFTWSAPRRWRARNPAVAPNPVSRFAGSTTVPHQRESQRFRGIELPLWYFAWGCFSQKANSHFPFMPVRGGSADGSGSEAVEEDARAFGKTGSPHEPRDDFHVGGIAELVDRRDRAHAIAGVGQELGVARERSGIA
jgi:hypothetical protein